MSQMLVVSFPEGKGRKVGNKGIIRNLQKRRGKRKISKTQIST